ncbi:MAG: hypothetical protein Q8K98_02825 [Bacteroidota bacterium]|nr:hypothetical protein [Bacteroidota bacterium]
MKIQKKSNYLKTKTIINKYAHPPACRQTGRAGICVFTDVMRHLRAGIR